MKLLVKEGMKTWRTELTSENVTLGEVTIKRGIFQGDALSPLLFVICLIPLSLVLRKIKPISELNGTEINHLLFMDDLKLYADSEEGVESSEFKIVSFFIFLFFVGIDKLHIMKTTYSVLDRLWCALIYVVVIARARGASAIKGIL